MIAFRILSASAGSACGPSAMAYINRLFEPELRVKPLGYWSFVTAGAPCSAWWRAGRSSSTSAGGHLRVQAPLCLVGVVVALWLLPDTDRLDGRALRREGVAHARPRRDARCSPASARGRSGGGRRRAPGVSGRLGMASLFTFVRIERRVADPLVVLDWFRTRNIAFPVLSQTLTNFAYMGGFILAPQVLQKGLELSESTSGLLVIARPLTFSLIAPLAGLVTIRVGERPRASPARSASWRRWCAGRWSARRRPPSGSW
jgi:MFS family permease